MSPDQRTLPDTLSTLSDSERQAIQDAIAHSAVLSAFDVTEVERLLSQSGTIMLEAGQYLFRQGDPSDSAFVVVSGVLSAMVEGDLGQPRVVGSVRAGECVGEMGVLTNSPRSLSVAARTPATLVRINAERFQAVCYDRPALLLKFLHLVSDRNRETIRALSPFKRARAVSIVPVHAGGLAAAFLGTLTQQLRSSALFDFADSSDAQRGAASAASGSVRPRVLVIDHQHSGWSQQCLEASDAVLLVADANLYGSPLGETARRVLESVGPYSHLEKELVLIHDSAPSETARWLEHGSFKRHHHVQVNDETDYQRFLRYLRGQSVTVVLSGGGIRGWVHLGALRALEERRVPIDCIGGSSVGAVVSACHLLNTSVDDTVASFSRVIKAIAQSIGVTNLTYPIVSILNGRRWTAAIKEEFGNRAIEDLPLPYFAVSCNISRNEEVVHRSGCLWEAVRSSSSLPALLPPYVKDGELFVDGGIANNVPVDVAKSIMGQTGRTIAIELSGTGDPDAREYNFPPVLSFVDTVLAKMRLRNREFKFISIGEVVFRSLAHGSMMKTNENLRGADIALRPTFTNQNFLTTNDPGGLLEMGYRSMVTQLDEKGDFR